jgi:hypothetical protein
MVSPLTFSSASCGPSPADAPAWCDDDEPQTAVAPLADLTPFCDPPAATPDTHRIERGETLSEIAVRYQVPLRVLAEANGLIDRDHVRSGRVLQIPIGKNAGASPSQLRVAPHDTLIRLALQHGQRPRLVASANLHTVRHPDLIRAGQALWMPGQHQVQAPVPCPALPSTRPAPPADRSTRSSDDLGTRRDTAARAWEAVPDRIEALRLAGRQDAAELWQPTAHAMQVLDDATRGLNPASAAQVLLQALPAFEACDDYVQSRFDRPTLGPRAFLTLMGVLDRVAATPEGDMAIQRIADRGHWDPAALTSAISQGAGANYALVLAGRPGMDADRVMDAAVDGMALLRQKTADDTLRYAEHMEEVGWLVNHLGGTMTPPQLDAAIDEYTRRKGTGWRHTADGLKAALVEDGARLLSQANALAMLSPQLAHQNERARTAVEAVLEDPLSQLAITAALQQRPEVALGRHWQAVLNFFSDAQYVSTAKMTDQARKLTSEFAQAYVKRNVLQHLVAFDPADALAMRRTQAVFEAMKDSRFASLLGVPRADLDKAVSTLQSMVPAVGGSPEAAAREVARLDRTLQAFTSFDKSTLAGRTLRMAGIALAGVGFLASVDRANDQLSTKNGFKVIVDAAGLGQKGIELAVALGKVEGTSSLGRMGGSGVGKFLGGLTAVYDMWNAAESLVQGELAQGALYGVGAGGGLMAAYGSGVVGPLGFVLVGGSVFGLGLLKDAERAERHEPSHDGGASVRFLQQAGLSDAAAHVLSDQSGEGHSVMPLIERYAQLRGLSLNDADQQQGFIDWINAMPAGDLAYLRNQLHGTADAMDGHAERLTTTTENDAERVPEIAGDYWYARGGQAQPMSAAQVDAVLSALNLPRLRPP